MSKKLMFYCGCDDEQNAYIITTNAYLSLPDSDRLVVAKGVIEELLVEVERLSRTLSTQEV